MALVDNKAKIQALLDGINALPEAGSGEPDDLVLQEKSVTPTKAAQAVTPDTGYDGLSKVNVSAIPDEYIIPSGTVSITQNGTHNVREAEAVNVNVPAPEITLQEKTVTPSTSAQTVTPDSGYDGLSKVTVNAMPTATQATPSISVSSAGLITASATQSAGYVSAGTKSATKQLTTQGAQTITPGTSDKTIASGRYLTGTQTIKGDVNLKAENIAKDVSIFGITGSYEGGGGGSGSVETCTIHVYEENGLSSFMSYTSLNDGEITAMANVSCDNTTISNVVCGTLVSIFYDSDGVEFNLVEVSGGVEFLGIRNTNRGSFMLFSAPTTAGGSGSIYMPPLW